MQQIPTPPELDIQTIELKKAAQVYRAINHPLRQQILKLVHSSMRMTVTELFIKLRLEQSVASQHLAILRKAGFMITEREGKYIFYSVNYNRLKEIQVNCEQLISDTGK